MTMPTRALCVLAFAWICASASAQGLIFREDFESGASGWTFGGIWHVESDTSTCGQLLAPFPSAGHCAWFGSLHAPIVGITCSYAYGYQGGVLARTTPILLPSTSSNLVLRYRRLLATQGCIENYDVTDVQITTNAGAGQLLFAYDCNNEPGWVDRRLDLNGLSGASVELRFEFHAGGLFQDTLGWAIDDVEIVTEPGLVTCGASTACPCMFQSNYHPFNPLIVSPTENNGGCKHSSHKEARLFGNGVQSVANDSVELVAHDLPQSTVALFVQGQTTQAGVFGDGRLCIGGPFVRMAVHNVSGGQDNYPHAGETGIALRGSVPAGGGTRMYQLVYRDSASFCTPSTFNTSNGYVIAWRP